MTGRLRSPLVFWFTAWLAVSACTSTPQAEPEPSGARQGWYAVRGDGHVLIESRADERFLPASVQKLLVTAAAFHYLDDLGTPDTRLETRAALRERADGLPPDVILSGGGDPGLGAGPDCLDTCLETLARAVAETGLRETTDVIGDATRLPDEPFAPGWSWDDLQWYYGAPVSALSVNGNVLTLSVAPGDAPGAPARVAWAPGDGLLGLDNQLITGPAGSPDAVKIDRLPGRQTVSVSGTIALDRTSQTFWLATPDPALAAATRFRDMLAANGVSVGGGVRIETRRTGEPEMPGATVLARLDPQPLLATIKEVNVDSDNLGAELLLRHIAQAAGGEGAADGLSAIRAMLTEAGVQQGDIDLYDASGLSTLNRVTPRAIVTFLRWTIDQPWGRDWRATLPVAGQTGTLRRRFAGSPLDGKMIAKTGTLTGVNALAGFIPGKRGEVIVFAVLSNERPATAPSVLPGIDRTLVGLAARD